MRCAPSLEIDRYQGRDPIASGVLPSSQNLPANSTTNSPPVSTLTLVANSKMGAMNLFTPALEEQRNRVNASTETTTSVGESSWSEFATSVNLYTRPIEGLKVW